MASPTPDPAGHPALIQPHGFLIGVTPDWQVAQASANIGEYLARPGASPIGEQLADVLGDEAVHTLRNRLSLLRDPQGSARVFALPASGATRPIDVQMHMAGDDIMIEAQPAAGQEGGDQIGLVRALAARLDGRDRLENLLEEGARQLRALTGFENVTLFRWTEGHAEIAGHSSRGDLAPASVPSRGSLRHIVDATASAIAIDRDGDPTPLDRCLLLAPKVDERAEIGNATSLIRLPMDGGGIEWGVAVCLNNSQRNLGLCRLAAAELFSDLLALRIALLEARG